MLRSITFGSLMAVYSQGKARENKIRSIPVKINPQFLNDYIQKKPAENMARLLMHLKLRDQAAIYNFINEATVTFISDQNELNYIGSIAGTAEAKINKVLTVSGIKKPITFDNFYMKINDALNKGQISDPEFADILTKIKEHRKNNKSKSIKPKSSSPSPSAPNPNDKKPPKFQDIIQKAKNPAAGNQKANTLQPSPSTVGKFTGKQQGKPLPTSFAAMGKPQGKPIGPPKPLPKSTPPKPAARTQPQKNSSQATNPQIRRQTSRI